jgi:hypothetical protein
LPGSCCNVEPIRLFADADRLVRIVPVPSHYKYGQSGTDCVAVAQRRPLHFPAIQECSVAAVQIANPAGGTFPDQRKVCAGHEVIISDWNVTLGAPTNFDGLPHWHSNLLSQQGAPLHLKNHIHRLFRRWKVLHTCPLRLVETLIRHTAYPAGLLHPTGHMLSDENKRTYFLLNRDPMNRIWS